MSMRSLEKLRDMLCEELDDIAEQGELNTGALEVIDKLVHSVKNIDKIMMADGYSRTGEWDAEGYMRGNSYRRGRDSMGRFTSRGSGYNRRGYSRDDGTDRAIEQLEDMLKDAGGESEHMAIKKAISVLKNA